MNRSLRRPYPRVRTGTAFSCGGNQGWFPDGNFRRCGCGVVACADALLYLQGVGELTREAYFAHVAALRRDFPLIPRRGIDGLRLALGMNRCLRRAGLPYRARWCTSGARFWDRLGAMLADDLPAIIAVGPNFPRLWGREGVTLYRLAEGGGYVPAERVRAHFLTVTGLDGGWLRVSTWGTERYLRRADYDGYMRRQSAALFTNLLLLQKI